LKPNWFPEKETNQVNKFLLTQLNTAKIINLAYINYSQMNFPENLHYTKDHEWIKVDGDTATIGITDYAQSELGDIVYVDIETIGQNLAAESVFGTVEAVKTVSDLFLPLSGTILEKNSKLDGQPELVNQDPYGEGWMIKMKVEDLSEIKHLMDQPSYQNLVGA